MEASHQPAQLDSGAGRPDQPEQVRDPRRRPLSDPAPSAAGVGPETRFSFIQVEVPWPLGPPDGRYLLRPGDAGEAENVIVVTTLGAPERRSRRGVRRARGRPLVPEPGPTPVATGRATVIDTARPLPDSAAAAAWLDGAGEPELAERLAVLNEVLRIHRVVATDLAAPAVAREACLVARIGFGAGAEVADGRWTQARELDLPDADRTRRRRVAPAHARLAAILAGRDSLLACEELILRARADLDAHRPREAALQLLVALDAAIAELGSGPRASELEARLGDLRGRRDGAAAAAQAALAGDPSAEQQAEVAQAVAAVEGALRTRLAGGPPSA